VGRVKATGSADISPHRPGPGRHGTHHKTRGRPRAHVQADHRPCQRPTWITSVEMIICVTLPPLFAQMRHVSQRLPFKGVDALASPSLLHPVSRLIRSNGSALNNLPLPVLNPSCFISIPTIYSISSPGSKPSAIMLAHLTSKLSHHQGP